MPFSVRSLRLALAGLAVATLAASAFGAPPRIAGCEVFPADNAWNTRVDSLRVHPSSGTWVSTIGATAALHPDFGTFFQGEPIGIPFTTVPASQPRVGMVFGEPGESDPGPYPIPADAPIEGGAASTGDRHVLVLERDNCILYELDDAHLLAGGAWQAFSGAVFDLKAQRLRPDTWTSADAAGLPILPGLVRYDEVQAGEIRHAIRFTAPQTQGAHVWPARHDASTLASAVYPPMGARFRLKTGFDESPYAPQVRVILRALKRYGMILADNGSPWFISGEHNPAWDDDILGQLKQLHGSDFEVVDAAPMQIAADSAQAFTPPPPIAIRTVANGFAAPTGMASPPDGTNRLFVMERAGIVRIVKDGAVLPTPFLDISSQVTVDGERGLLGIAFHPRYATNRRFFLYHTDLVGDVHISGFVADSANPDVAVKASQENVITIPHSTFGNHNGGALAFGPDGYLYAGVGDGGSALDPPNNAQNLGVLLGKILRLDIDVPSGHAIPPDNPLVNYTPALPEIWAYGLRNPWRISFDRLTGDLYIGDVGQDTAEELDVVRAGTRAPLNFLWKICEGFLCPSGIGSAAFPTLPVLQYLHDAQGGNSITGGFVYRGLKSPALQGWYVFGDFISNRIWAARQMNGVWKKFVLYEPPPTVFVAIPSFAEDANGELYGVGFDGGIHAIDGPPRDVGTPPPTVAEAPRAIDFDRDGKADLAWKHASGLHGVWLMDGAAPSAAAGVVPPADATLRLVASFSGAAGAPSMLWRHADGAYSITTVDGTTTGATVRILDGGSGWEVVGSGDFDGDGKADLLWRSATDEYGVWLMDGTTRRAFASIGSLGPGWEVIMAGRFSGTARTDLLWRHVDGSVRMTPMASTTMGAPVALQGPMQGWLPTQAGDFDGDGATDLVWTHPDGRVRMMLMSAAGGTSTDLLGAGTGWSPWRVADLDGDGRADLLWRHSSGIYGAWLMNGAAAGASSLIYDTPNSGWDIVATGDFNGDGKADLVWRKDTGEYGTWLMDGLASTDYRLVLQAGTRWELAP